MIRSFRMFPERPRAPVELEVPLDRTSSCTRCSLHERAHTVCLPAEGNTGGVLFVGEGPGVEEDARGMPMVGKAGKYLRGVVGKLTSDPVAYDNALRCPPPRSGVKADSINACRGYLAHTIIEVQPKRIVCLGNVAMEAVLGRSVPLLSIRRGYGWVDRVPAFLIPHPVAALRNAFVRQWFEQDLHHALTCTIPALPHWTEEAVEITTSRDTQLALDDMYQLPPTAFDCETAGRLYGADFRLLSLSMTDGVTVYVWGEEALKDVGVAARLREFFTSPNTRLTGANIKYDLGCIRHALGIVVPWGNVGHDIQLERKLIDVEAKCRLEYLAELVGEGGIKAESVAEMKEAKKACKAAGMMNEGDKMGSHTFAYLPRDVLLRRNALDSRTTHDLTKPVMAHLQSLPNRIRVWETITRPAISAIAQMEAWGVPVSSDALRVLSSYLEQRKGVVEARLKSEYGGDFNPGSDMQVAELLFNKLGLPSGRKTATGRSSVDAEVLESLAGRHRAVDDLLEYRGLTTGSGANASSLLRFVGGDGRLHPSIHIDGARSGRVSCSDPNMLNQPRADTELGKMVRDCFVADAGNVILEADYSQIEYRVAAALSGDPVMREAFLSGEDFHLRTAKLVSLLAWGIPPDAVQKIHRQAAKSINFGKLYRMGDESLSKTLKCKLSEARRISNAVDGQFRVLKAWINQQIGEARRTGVVWTMWDGEKARCRPVWQILDADGKSRAHAESVACNTPVQGTASDYGVMSLIVLVDWILRERFPAKLCLTVYDSLLFEVSEKHKDELAQKVTEVMTGWPIANGIPLLADLKIGKTWGSMEHLEVEKPLVSE